MGVPTSAQEHQSALKPQPHFFFQLQKQQQQQHSPAQLPAVNHHAGYVPWQQYNPMEMPTAGESAAARRRGDDMGPPPQQLPTPVWPMYPYPPPPMYAYPTLGSPPQGATFLAPPMGNAAGQPQHFHHHGQYPHLSLPHNAQHLHHPTSLDEQQHDGDTDGNNGAAAMNDQHQPPTFSSPLERASPGNGSLEGGHDDDDDDYDANEPDPDERDNKRLRTD
jgi:hypothetical protein